MANLEKEVQKQTELRVMYKKRMERTQDYLRYCLQIAQENGILNLIKEELQQSPLSIHTSISTIASPAKSPTHSHHHPSLAAITNQAKINGWYIEPTEVSTYVHSTLTNQTYHNNILSQELIVLARIH